MFTLVLAILAILLAIPIAVLAAEVAAACLVSLRSRISPSRPLALSPPCSKDSPRPSPRPPIAVLIPAHNEEAGITRTIASILPQLGPDDRLLVVADNCTDSTAALARAAGAEVVERANETERGKGFALAAGVEYLASRPPDELVIVDADTPLEPGTVQSIVTEAVRSGQPVQAVYLMGLPAGAPTKSAISAFAFCLKNQVRPMGAQRFGIPAYLTGTAMAFPWTVLSQARLATGNIVEDMQLGIDLAIAGHPPRLCPEARVFGTLPQSTPAAATQRKRWEHGHMQTILHNVPRLLWAELKQGRLSLVGLALDLAVPPLALLVSIWALVTLAAGAAAVAELSSAFPLYLLLASGGLLAAGILLAWARFARQILPFSTLTAIPLYILWKLPLYVAFLFRRQKAWVRTAR